MERVEARQGDDITLLSDEFTCRQFLFGHDAIDRSSDRALIESSLRPLEFELRKLALLLFPQQFLFGNAGLGTKFLVFVLRDDQSSRQAGALHPRARQLEALFLRIDPRAPLGATPIEPDRLSLA